MLMRTVFPRSQDYGVAVFTAFCTVALSSAVMAQWPISYTEPRQLSAGYALNAANVVSLADGGVIVAHPTKNTADGIVASRYDGDATARWENLSVNDNCRPEWIKIFPSDSPDQYNVISAFGEPARGLYSPYLGGIYSIALATGKTGGWTAWFNFHQIKVSVPMDNGVLITVVYNSKTHSFNTFSGTARDVSPGIPKEFSGVATGPDSCLFSYTHNEFQKETASRIQLGSATSGQVGAEFKRVEDQGAERQSSSQLTRLNSNYMLTWLGDLNGKKRLYSKVFDRNKEVVNNTRLLMNDVIDYQCTTSTLGVPVIAVVTRTFEGAIPSDTLSAGLIDPVNGNVLTLPFARGLGLKVKALRQEANGDFSLVYSVPENGTTLLKVRRISGTTAGTVWETTVADLGTASDELIKDYPNTWVSGSATGVLYIASRCDQPYTGMTSLNLVRLRADGLLGSDNGLQKPTNFQAVAAGTGQVNLSWTDNSISETSYLVGRTTTDFAHIELIGVLPANSTTFTDAFVQSGQTYHYYVASFIDATGELALTDEATVNVP